MDLSEQVNEFRVLKNTIGFVCLTYCASSLCFKYKFIKQLFLRDSTQIALKSGSKCLLPKLSDAFLSGRYLRAEKILFEGNMDACMDGVSLYLEKNFENNLINILL